jgi:hypothetical protein
MDVLAGRVTRLRSVALAPCERLPFASMAIAHFQSRFVIGR